MKTFKKTTITQEKRLIIEYDELPESPRLFFSNLGYFLTKDNKYNSPDGEYRPELQKIMEIAGEEASSQEKYILMMKIAIEDETEEKVIKIYPITKYEHSAISYKLGNLSGFDYSNNGFYIITDKSQENLGIEKEDFEKIIKEELEFYNSYINGEVYSFKLFDEKGNVVDSGSSMYSLDDIKQQLIDEHKGDGWDDEDMNDYLI
jgi:hypothetical protein